MMKICSYCGAPLDDDALFCSNCGKKIELQGMLCPRCGVEVMADSTFCSKCGLKIDAPPSAHFQEEEARTRVWQEEKNRTWWYVIGAAAIALLAFGSYYVYEHYSNINNENIIQLSSMDESYFIDLVKRWDETHNRREFDEYGENNPYAEIVNFYGVIMSGLEAHLKKVELLVTNPDFRQNSENIKVTQITEKIVLCEFDKYVLSNGKSSLYPECYIYFVDVGDGLWKIIEESDPITDHNLNRHRSDPSEIQELYDSSLGEGCG